MTGDELRAIQAPFKARYKEDPESARLLLTAEGEVRPQGLTCLIGTKAGLVEAGLHPSAGGDGSAACAGAMLLEALVGCAGVTMGAVAMAMGIELRGGIIRAEGEMDMRGTLGVTRDVQVGLTSIRLEFRLDTDASVEQVAKLIQLTERYCVVYQTLKNSPTIATRSSVTGV